MTRKFNPDLSEIEKPENLKKNFELMRQWTEYVEKSLLSFLGLGVKKYEGTLDPSTSKAIEAPGAIWASFGYTQTSTSTWAPIPTVAATTILHFIGSENANQVKISNTNTTTPMPYKLLVVYRRAD